MVVDAAKSAAEQVERLIGGRRRRRRELLEALVDLDSFLQGLPVQMVDAAVRWIGLPNEAKDWQRLSAAVLNKALAFPDWRIRELAAELQKIVGGFVKILHDPASLRQIGKTPQTQRFPGEIARDMLFRTQQMSLPFWRRTRSRDRKEPAAPDNQPESPRSSSTT